MKTMTLLTEKKTQIARLVWEEFPNRKIAEKLKNEESTVKNHMGNMCAKLGVHSRIGLVKKLL